MFLFHFTSWLKQRLQEERRQADSLEDFAQTFILEPIYTPSGFLDGGDDADGADLTPVGDPGEDM
ncbi:MAG: hypothetical protein R6U67_08090, partial [Sodalinema sp.]|uniref:hypothetical protein n=1 Tax=Sodalinema sp. TaxID=3080550 RepID=UPI00396F4AE8